MFSIILEKSPVNGYFCATDPGEPVWKQKRLSINDIEAGIIAEFARGRDVLEIGTGLGVSTRKMAETATLVYTVDIDPWVAEAVAPTLPENVRFFKSIDDYGIMPGFDMVFVDGCHDFKYCVKDIQDARRLAKPNGVILFHDYNMPQVARAVALSGLDVVVINTFAGLGLAWNR